jgi:aspartyl protease family protein
VRGLVAPAGALDQSLLGMSFLDTLTSYSVAGDRLILKP